MKNILITGGAGFIGSNLSSFLINKKFNITIVDDLSTGKKSNVSGKKINFFKKDVININTLKINKKIDIIIHLAARAEILITQKQESIYAKANIQSLQSALNFASRNSIKKFIFASSASIYGDTKNKPINENYIPGPKHFYGYTKLVGEEMIKHYSRIHNFNYTIFRFFNIYGNNSNAVVAKFIAQKLQKKKITIYGTGKQKRDFLHIDDLSRAILKSIKIKKSNNQTYNLGSSKPTSIIDLKNIISKSNDHVFLERRSDDIEISISNIEKIKRHLKWKPIVDIKTGVLDMVNKGKKKLLKFRIPSVVNQKKLIASFNRGS